MDIVIFIFAFSNTPSTGADWSRNSEERRREGLGKVQRNSKLTKEASTQCIAPSARTFLTLCCHGTAAVRMGWVSALLLLTLIGEVWTCMRSPDFKMQSDQCRAELANTIIYAKVVAIYKEAKNIWMENYSAELELLCDQARGSIMEMPAGRRFNLTGLGDFICHSYTVMENNTYYLFVRMEGTHNFVLDAINYQDPIFPDTTENKQMFSGLFKSSNCGSGARYPIYAPEWELQEDNRKMKSLEKSNNNLRKQVKYLLRQRRK
ncbi:coiled-coil domain-containing protein 3-like [Rhinoraja longicauda]